MKDKESKDQKDSKAKKTFNNTGFNSNSNDDETFGQSSPTKLALSLSGKKNLCPCLRTGQG